MPRSTSPSSSGRLVALVTLVCAALFLAGCGESGTGTKEPSPAQVMQKAKKHFDDASSVHIDLATAATPSSGNGVLGASGTVTHAPAFEGDVKVVLSGLTATVPITAVGGKVYAKLPMQTKFAVINPAEYGAPDPSDFADPERGLSALIGKLQHLKKSKQTRSGDQILTTYTGTLPGRAVKAIIPSADANGSYKTSIGIDEQGYARKVSVTGTFFSGNSNVTYDVDFSKYDGNVRVVPPKG
jgi:lipoprotein LprG